MKNDISAKLINAKLITDYMKENKLSKAAFAKKCHIGISSLNNILTNNLNIGIKALFKVSRILNIRMNDMFIS